ncbi:MAG TPA: DUF3078 domain-containing protein [Flavisolibacter sp.]|nr:DUF3078 domain-containing protein [Flavisolibacter sp.]
MKKLLTAFFLLASFMVKAQDQTVKDLSKDATKTIKKPEDTLQQVWRRGGLYSFNISQGSLTNWAAGGDKFSLAVSSILNLYSFYKKDKHSWDNTLDFNLGYVNTTSLGSRKNDDRIDLLSIYGRSVAPKWNVSALANFRSQLFKGYTYKDDVQSLSSAFLSPGYLLASIGMDYKPGDHFSLFLSPAAARWVFVKNDSLSAKGLYGVEPGKHSRSEFGAFVSANYLNEFNKTVSYKGRLDLFSNYKHNPEKIDVYMTNVLLFKLSKLLSASWNVDLIYDDDVRLFGNDGKSPAVQLKSLVGIGLQAKF